MGRRDVFGGQSCAVAEEELFHLFDEEGLRLWGPGLEAVFVEQHLLALDPLVPSLAGDAFVDFLTEFRVEGRFVEALHLLFVARAKDHMCHG
uniref:Uncharacterized protein n=1 Tax=mine drainage metagenome TaxID=410659 RepID=E6QNC6_9ZZZZ